MDGHSDFTSLCEINLLTCCVHRGISSYGTSLFARVLTINITRTISQSIQVLMQCRHGAYPLCFTHVYMDVDLYLPYNRAY